jgi:DNA-binding transcriptional regulator YdaS (Cro superfamily)
MIDWLRGRRPAVAPDEVRAIRQEAGWTQAQVAEELGVLPLEVSAWEAGAVPVDPYQAALIRWQIEQAQYAARLPRPDCDWTRANQARLERMDEQGLFAGQRAKREVAEHTRKCAECMRVEMLLKEMPAAPEPPVKPGPRGWMDSVRRRIDRLPAWLRLPLVTAELLLGLVPAYLFYRLVRWGKGGEASVSPLGMLAIGAGLLWILVLGWRLLPLATRRPHLAGQLFAAGIVLPALLLVGTVGSWDLTTVGPWIFAGVVSVLIGVAIGASAADAMRDAEAAD